MAVMFRLPLNPERIEVATISNSLQADFYSRMCSKISLTFSM